MQVSVSSFQRKFLWTHKEADLAPHPVVGLVFQVGDGEKFPHALGFEIQITLIKSSTQRSLLSVCVSRKIRRSGVSRTQKLRFPPFVDNLELSHVLSLKPRAGQNIALSVSPTARNSCNLPTSAFSVLLTSVFPKHLPRSTYVTRVH